MLSSIASGLHLSAERDRGLRAPPDEPPEPRCSPRSTTTPELTARQRTVLAETYRSFVELNVGAAATAGERSRRRRRARMSTHTTPETRPPGRRRPQRRGRPVSTQHDRFKLAEKLAAETYEQAAALRVKSARVRPPVRRTLAGTPRSREQESTPPARRRAVAVDLLRESRRRRSSSRCARPSGRQAEPRAHQPLGTQDVRRRGSAARPAPRSTPFDAVQRSDALYSRVILAVAFADRRPAAHDCRAGVLALPRIAATSACQPISGRIKISRCRHPYARAVALRINAFARGYRPLTLT